ncbi:zinc finger protein 37-like [Cheilinus undulatus]|uniref:zinc finger protein 37-like n=1 Tax=Cheilinus undulatus TaxID=241271 RepID=UPI001BD5C316|nr:zinc finger protein 37-like [Cheilinus undulatus]
MGIPVFHLRSFVHQRLSAAAEEIFGEVEKTITALFEAEVCRSKEEVESLRNQLDLLQKKQAEEPSLTSSTVEHEDQCDTHTLDEKPEQCTLSGSDEVPGPSQTNSDLVRKSWSCSLVQKDLKVSEIKVEEEEHCVDDVIQKIIFPSSEIVKSEENQPEDAFHEMPLLSVDCSDTQAEIKEELLNSKGDSTTTTEAIVQVQIGNPPWKSHQRIPYNSHSARNEKRRSFCHLCGKGFRYIGSLMKHIKAHDKNIDCSVCGVACQSNEDLIDHMKVKHSIAYLCNICGKTFASSLCLQLHEKIHAEVRDFTCQECGKTFYRKDHLVVHVRTHSGEKPYHCDVCGKAFSQSQNLTIHKRRHSGEKPYHCATCGKFFCSGGQLKMHMLYHSEEKLYPCDICGKRFHESVKMIRHRTTHTKERPYACHICGIKYRFASSLTVHLQSHNH